MRRPTHPIRGSWWGAWEYLAHTEYLKREGCRDLLVRRYSRGRGREDRFKLYEAVRSTVALSICQADQTTGTNSTKAWCRMLMMLSHWSSDTLQADLRLKTSKFSRRRWGAFRFVLRFQMVPTYHTMNRWVVKLNHNTLYSFPLPLITLLTDCPGMGFLFTPRFHWRWDRSRTFAVLDKTCLDVSREQRSIWNHDRTLLRRARQLLEVSSQRRFYPSLLSIQ